MGLLRGSATVTRFKLASPPSAAPDFDRLRFEEIPPTSEIRERVGFVPYQSGAPYEVAARRWAFRVRIDRRKPDPTAVRERLAELVQTELEATGRDWIGSKRRRELKHLAEEELLTRATPRSKIVECCLDGRTLYVGTTAKSDLGLVLQALRSLGVNADPDTPWSGEPEDFDSELAVAREPGQSVLGCRFLRALLDDGEVMVEPVSGSARLVTREARVSLAGEILPELLRYVEAGAEILSAKLVVGDHRFRFDAPSYRIQSLRVETENHEHWTGLLDERLEKIAALWEMLDQKYRQVRSRLDRAPAAAAPPLEAVGA